MRLLFLTIAAVLWMGMPSAHGEQLFDVNASDQVFNEGLDLYFKGNYSGAIDRFEESIRINPENAKAHYFIGYSYYKVSEFTQAGVAFATAYELDKTYTPISP